MYIIYLSIYIYIYIYIYINLYMYAHRSFTLLYQIFLFFGGRLYLELRSSSVISLSSFFSLDWPCSIPMFIFQLLPTSFTFPMEFPSFNFENSGPFYFIFYVAMFVLLVLFLVCFCSLIFFLYFL